MATRTISLERFTRELGELRSKLIPTAAVAMKLTVEDMIGDVVAKRMSGQYLGVVTGAARRSVTGRVDQDADSVTGVFGSPLEYVRAHELGFQGDVQVKGHTRRLIQPGFHRGRVSKKSVREMRRAIRKGRKRYAYVRPHRRHVKITEKNFFRDTLYWATGQPPFPPKSIANKRMGRALAVLIRKGAVPTAGEVLGT